MSMRDIEVRIVSSVYTHTRIEVRIVSSVYTHTRAESVFLKSYTYLPIQ